MPFVLNVNFVMSGMAMLRTASQSILKSKKSHLRPPSSLSAVRIVRPSLDVSASALEVEVACGIGETGTIAGWRYTISG